MPNAWVQSFLLGFVLTGSCLYAQQQSPDPPTPPPLLPTLSPPLPPPWIFVPRPDPLPSPSDMPVPDAGSLHSAPDPSHSPFKRALDRALPRCLDAVTHTCWSSPPADPSFTMAQADREFANDMEIGNLYFGEKNYRGAEFRFRDALTQKPNDQAATFRLAQSLEKQHKSDEAKQIYKSCLDLQPAGPYGERARNALSRLNATAAGK